MIFLIEANDSRLRRWTKAARCRTTGLVQRNNRGQCASPRDQRQYVESRSLPSPSVGEGGADTSPRRRPAAVSARVVSFFRCPRRVAAFTLEHVECAISPAVQHARDKAGLLPALYARWTGRVLRFHMRMKCPLPSSDKMNQRRTGKVLIVLATTRSTARRCGLQSFRPLSDSSYSGD